MNLLQSSAKQIILIMYAITYAAECRGLGSRRTFGGPIEQKAYLHLLGARRRKCRVKQKSQSLVMRVDFLVPRTLTNFGLCSETNVALSDR